MAEIEKIINKEAIKYEGRQGRGGLQIPQEVVSHLEKKFDELGVFTLPIKTLNKLIGIEAEEGRGYFIKNKLNSQYPLPDKEWKVGTTGDDYIIKIVDVKEEEQKEVEG